MGQKESKKSHHGRSTPSSDNPTPGSSNPGTPAVTGGRTAPPKLEIPWHLFGDMEVEIPVTPLPWSYICNECGGDIPRLRYTCSECLHYDLCPACFEAGKHREHLLYRERLHPQQIFDILVQSPSSGQALLKVFKYYAHRQAFAYRDPIKKSKQDLAKSIEERIEQETSEKAINVNLRGDNLTPLNPFKWITFAELGQRVHDVGCGLRQLVEPRQFVGICSHVQLNWYIADYACQVHSIIGPIIGPTSSLEAFVHIINSTKMTLVFCTETLTPRFLTAAESCPTLKYIIQLEDLDDFEVRPKVKAAVDGLRQSAARNLLRQSQGGGRPSSSNPNPSSSFSNNVVVVVPEPVSGQESSANPPADVESKEGKNDDAKSQETSASAEPTKVEEKKSDEPKKTEEKKDETSEKEEEKKPPKAETSTPASHHTKLPPLLTPEDVADWKAKMAKTEGVIVLSFSDLERLGQNVEEPEVVVTKPDEVETLVYTSGSTGIPKGAIYSAQAWKEQLCFASAHPDITRTVSWSISDRKNDYRHLYYGGLVAVYNGDMSRIFEDMADIKPHAVNATPAFWNKIYAEFKVELAERAKDVQPPSDAYKTIRKEVLKEFCGLLGGRVEKIVTGGAPSSQEVLSFMRECWLCRVRESYGTTECGGVASEGLFVPGLQWKLVSWEEYTTEDKPYPRGELLVKRSDMMSGYYGEQELTQDALDSEGFYHTGDIVELNMYSNGAAVIDRKKNIFKLSQGEYVAPAKVEKLLVGQSPFVKQVFVYGDSLKSSLVAVIVPHVDPLMEHFINLPASQSQLKSKIVGLPFASVCTRPEAVDVLLAECARVGKQHNLRTFEIPAAVVLSSSEFTKENGLYTQSDKPQRHALLKHFKTEIEGLYASLDSKHTETKAAVYKLLGQGLANATSNQVVIDPNAKDDESNLSFVQMGGDSLTAIKLRNMIKKNFDVTLPVDVLLNPNTDLAKIATYIDDSKRSNDTISADQFAAPQVDLRTLMKDSRLHTDWKPPKDKASSHVVWNLSKLKHILLTGASGFLGTALLAELLKSTTATIYCLIRPRKDSTRQSGRNTADASSLQEVLERRISLSGLLGENPLKLMKKPFNQRVVIVEGSLEAPMFGLKSEDWRLLQDKVQVVFNAAAYVNSVLPYHRLAPSNVEGTRTCIELCSAGSTKLLVHISTNGVVQAKQNRSEIPLEGELWTKSNELLKLGGYNISKYIAELLVWEAVDRGYPCIVVRPGFIGSAAQTGFSNDNDFDNRLLIGLTQLKVAPDSVSPMISFPVDYMCRVITEMAQTEACNGCVYHLVNGGSELSLKLIVEVLKANGYEITTTPYADWQKLIQGMTDEKNPIYTMVEEYFSRPYMHFRQPGQPNDKAMTFIKEHMKNKLPPTDASYVSLWVHWLQNQNLIVTPNATDHITASLGSINLSVANSVASAVASSSSTSKSKTKK